MNKEYDFKIKNKQLEYLYSNLTSAVVAALIIAALTYLALINEVDRDKLDIWIVSTVLVTILRIYTYKIYKNKIIDSKNISKYFILFFSLMLLASLLWAFIPIFIFPENIEYQILIFFMLGGLTAGAMISLAVKHNYYLVYLFVTILPILIVVYLEDTRLTNFIFIAGTIYIIFLSIASKRISLKIIENITLIYDNEELIDRLKQKANEANIANEAKSKFLSVMSHEIRTPLNAIVGFIKILKDTDTNVTQDKYLNTIESSSHLLMSVLNDVLDISKIESGNFKIEVITYEPYTEIYQLYDLYERTASQNDINLINSISMDMPIFLEGDILRLKQIVSNLLSNAIKFTPKGKTIELIVDFEKEKSMLYVEVKDAGIGIKKDNIYKITQEFMQADDSTARKYGGTGLGLSIVTKLLSLQNSKLEIESKYGYGSRFYFSLPVSLSTKTKKEIQEKINYDFSGKKILVAEDNKTNQMLISIILEDLDIEVSMANDGQEAEDMFKDNDYDLILMDINMPNKNGYEAMHAIKKFNRDIAIVALTANAVSGDREKFINDGFDNYLEKPIDNKELLIVLKKYLEK